MVKPYGDGSFGRCVKCGADDFPITAEAAGCCPGCGHCCGFCTCPMVPSFVNGEEATMRVYFSTDPDPDGAGQDERLPCDRIADEVLP